MMHKLTLMIDYKSNMEERKCKIFMTRMTLQYHFESHNVVEFKEHEHSQHELEVGLHLFMLA